MPAPWSGRGRTTRCGSGLQNTHREFRSSFVSRNTSSILDEDHPLAQAAIRWVRGSRYDPRDDHRLAVRVLETIDSPDLVASYIVRIRAGDNTEMERLMAVR